MKSTKLVSQIGTDHVHNHNAREGSAISGFCLSTKVVGGGADRGQLGHGLGVRGGPCSRVVW